MPEETPPMTANAFVTRASLFARLRSPEPVSREEAWRDFMTRYAPIIAGFARRCGAGGADVDDIVQDVAAAFFSVSDQFSYDPSRGRFRGWLKTTTVRAALRRAGKNLRFRGMPLADVPDLELAVEPEWNDLWDRQRVTEALAVLKQEWGGKPVYQAFERYVLKDRPAADVAAELGISVDSVHQAKTRMTRRLQALVKQAEETSE